MKIEWRDLSDNVIDWREIPVDRIVDFYELLEVSPRASPEIIRRAYRVLAERYHPDKHTAERKPWAEEMMKMVNVAYSTLSDDQQRRAYDTERERRHRRQ